MNTQQKLSDIVLSLTNMPTELENFQEKLVNNIQRLYYLLYGKDRKINYEGPLYNKLNDIDFLGITELIVAWMIETLYKYDKKKYNKDAHKLFYDYSFTKISIELMSKIIQKNIFKLNDEQEVNKFINLFNDKHTIHYLNNKVEDIIEKIDTFSYWTKKSNIKKLVNKIGYNCTHLNSLQTVEDLEIELMTHYEHSDAVHNKTTVEEKEDDNIIVEDIVENLIENVEQEEVLN